MSRRSSEHTERRASMLSIRLSAGIQTLGLALRQPARCSGAATCVFSFFLCFSRCREGGGRGCSVDESRPHRGLFRLLGWGRLGRRGGDRSVASIAVASTFAGASLVAFAAHPVTQRGTGPIEIIEMCSLRESKLLIWQGIYVTQARRCTLSWHLGSSERESALEHHWVTLGERS